MIIFHNPGDLDLEAVRLMGASVKKPGSFGRFGTGLKYAIASIIRGGASLELFVAGEEYRFGTIARQVKGEDFAEVVMYDASGREIALGFTTALGRDWEPWMVVRELACNARDEGGDFTLWEDPNWSPSGEGTEFKLDWPELEAQWDELLDKLFIPRNFEPKVELEGVRIFPFAGDHIYHRGVRVMKLPKPSVFMYDITGPMDLTEDRTAKYAFIVEENVRRALLACEDPEVIAGAVSNVKGWEGALKWTDETWRKPVPGVLWLEEVARLRARGVSVADDAKKLFLAHRAVKEAQTFGGYYRDKTPAGLSIALEELESLHVKLKDTDLYVTDELPGEQLSMATGGRIYLSEETLRLRPYIIARELLTRHLELTAAGDHDQLLSMTVELLLRASEVLERDRGHYLEESRAVAA